MMVHNARWQQQQQEKKLFAFYAINSGDDSKAVKIHIKLTGIVCEQKKSDQFEMQCQRSFEWHKQHEVEKIGI